MNLPKRQHPRLKEYDHSRGGHYFVTICTQDNKPILSAVGRGLAPADTQISLTPIGTIAEKQLFDLENRYGYVKIDKYVIMPTHIHAIIVLEGNTARASRRPTLTDMICAYKSLTTRICNYNNKSHGRKIFQTSFYDEVIETDEHYYNAWQYIDQNPLKWTKDKYYCE